jgi:hypothetical protein
VDIVLVVLAAAVVACTAAVPAAALAGRSLAAFVLATWLFAWIEVAAVSGALSLAHAFQRVPLLVSFAVLLAASAVAKRRSGIRLPPLRPGIDGVRDAVHDPVLAVLAATAGAAFAYVVALGVFVAPNEDDALAYHLLRAALWKQDHAIGWLGPYVDGRANAFPPLAEIGVAATMVVGGTERLVALPQLTALPVAALSAFALGRRIGLDVRPSLFGALCFFLLPFPLIQSQTALNDVVLISLTGAAAVFVLGSRTKDLLLAGVAVMLMVATKTPAFLVLPALALLALLMHPLRRLPAVATVGAAAIALGSSWYFVTLGHSGSLAGGLSEHNMPARRLDVVEMVGRFLRYVLSSLELPAAPGSDRLLYPLAGAVLGAAGIVLGRRALALAGAIVASTALLLPLGRATDRVWLEAWEGLGQPVIANFESPLDPPYARYAGPAGLLLLIASTALGVRLLRRGRLPRPAAALLAAPLLSLLTLAILIGYLMDNPRLVLGGVVLAAGTWGLAYSIRAVAVSAAALSAVLALTAVVWYPKKPAGLRLLEPVSEQSAWTRPRWVLQEKEEGTAPFLRLIAEVVPEDARLAVSTGIDPYTFFGPRLSRHVEPVSSHPRALDADWLVLAGGATPACPSAWTTVPGPPGEPWALYRRTRQGCPIS